MKVAALIEFKALGSTPANPHASHGGLWADSSMMPKWIQEDGTVHSFLTKDVGNDVYGVDKLRANYFVVPDAGMNDDSYIWGGSSGNGMYFVYDAAPSFAIKANKIYAPIGSVGSAGARVPGIGFTKTDGTLVTDTGLLYAEVLGVPYIGVVVDDDYVVNFLRSTGSISMSQFTSQVEITSGYQLEIERQAKPVTPSYGVAYRPSMGAGRTKQLTSLGHELDITGFLGNRAFYALWAAQATFDWSGHGSTPLASGTWSGVGASQGNPRRTRATSAATAAAGAGVNSTVTFLFHGASTDWAASGMEFEATFYLNDASYNNTGASTGSRIFFGLSGANDVQSLLTLDTMVASSTAAGFLRRNVNGGSTDTNWQFATRNSAGGMSAADTGMAFAVAKWYTVRFSHAPGGASFYWEIFNHTDGTSASGTHTPVASMPAANAGMGVTCGVYTVNAVARTVDINQVWAAAAC